MDGRRRFRFLPGSIRFRLTAWYALLLALVLVALGFSVLRLAEDKLGDDMDQRLKKTAYDIEAAIVRSRQEPDIDVVDGRLTLVSIEDTVNFDSFAARRLLIQVVGVTDRVIEQSPYAPERVLLSASQDGVDPNNPETQTVRFNEEDFRVVRFPLIAKNAEDSSAVVGAILVGEPLAAFYETLGSLRRTLLTTSVGGLALAIVGGWLMAGRALRPVDRVTAAAAAIATGDGSAASLTTRLRVPETGDEIARLSATFNAMLDRLQASFAAQQRFVADASHELRTPLTAIRGNVEVLARQAAAGQIGHAVDEDLDAALTDMGRESARMGRLLDDLLLLARSDAPEPEARPPRPVRLDEIACDAVRSASALADGQRVEALAPEPVTVEGDADRLLQLVLILLENALRHTPSGGRVVVEVDPPADGSVHLVVRDEGEGIAPEHVAHVFDRFYRADGARGRATGGTGLGLAIARVVARAHGGEIEVASAPGRGSTFTVTLPTGGVRPEIVPAQPQSSGPLWAGGTPPA